MKLTFIYNKDEDIWCLLNKGKTSINSATPTTVYQELVSEVGENPDKISTSTFIDNYLVRNNFEPMSLANEYQKAWEHVSVEFQSVAEKIFGVSLDKNITVYLTINNRCPYGIEENLFFVPISQKTPTRIAMHELWHFYTWYKFGPDEPSRLGAEKYNNLKEALTVLLNIECKHLLSEGDTDKGYPQHQQLRSKIIELWKQNPDIEYVWKEAQLFDFHI